jgi:hypothetical protein
MKQRLRDTVVIFGGLCFPYMMYEWFGVPGLLFGIAFLIACIDRKATTPHAKTRQKPVVIDVDPL